MPVNLHGIGADYIRIKLFCKQERDARLADAGRAEEYNDFFVSGYQGVCHSALSVF